MSISNTSLPCLTKKQGKSILKIESPAINKPVLILLGIGVVCGVGGVISKHKPPKYNPNMTEKERTQWVIDKNQKRIDKIMRKYR